MAPAGNALSVFQEWLREFGGLDRLTFGLLVDFSAVMSMEFFFTTMDCVGQK
jgi:hypothetical protein